MIWHGPGWWGEDDLLGAKTLTAYGSIGAEGRQAGGTWVEESLVRSEGEGWSLINSRSPDGLAGFSAAVVDAAR